MTPKQKQKRRAREAQRRREEVQAQHGRELVAAEGRGKLIGFDAGHKIGSQETRDLVLGQAGELYKANRDSDAAAVRVVHAFLVRAQGGSTNMNTASVESSPSMEPGRRAAITHLCERNQIGADIRDMLITSGASLKEASDRIYKILAERGRIDISAIKEA